jgi:copper chaperone
MKKTIYIEGMSCGHCVAHVKEALEELTGVEAVEVNLKEKLAKVDVLDTVTDAQIKAAIDEVGYEVVSIKA